RRGGRRRAVHRRARRRLHHGGGHSGRRRLGDGPLSGMDHRAKQEGPAMGLLDGKRILITGVLTDSSIAFHVARVAQQEGATVVLTGFGRLTLVQRIAKRLPGPPPGLELDVTNPEQLDSLADRVGEHVGSLDGVLHGIANAPASALGGSFLETPWPDVSAAVHVSTYSLKALAMAALPLMKDHGGALGGVGFDARPARPAYECMGGCKGRLASRP